MNYEFIVEGENHRVSLNGTEGKIVATVDGRKLELDVHRISPQTFSLVAGGKSCLAHAVRRGRSVLVAIGADSFCLQEPEESGASVYSNTGQAEAGGTIKAPMPGLVIKVDVSEGTEVGPGDVLAVVEAMKMEHEMRAPFKAVITKVYVQPGRQVDAFQPLLELEKSDS